MKSNHRQTLNELEGWSEIGKGKEALRLARSMLVSADIDAVHFGVAMKAVLTFANKLEPWTETVEAVFRRFAQNDREKAKSWMLGFYYSQNDFEQAARFIPRKFQGTDELLFAIGTLVELGRFDEAAQVARQCEAILSRARKLSPPERDHLHHALAEYYGAVARYDDALKHWERMEPDSALLENAIVGAVMVRVARAIQEAKGGLKKVDRFRRLPHNDIALVLPRVDEKLARRARRELRRILTHLERILPKEKRHKLGLAD